jgi:hypothetical protein
VVEGKVKNVMARAWLFRGVLRAVDDLLWVESWRNISAHFFDHGWLKIQADDMRDVLARPGLREERLERVIADDWFVRRHLPVRLNWSSSHQRFRSGNPYAPHGPTELHACCRMK